VTKGYEDLADYASTLSQGQLRALKFRLDPHTRRVRCPKQSCFAVVLAEVNPEQLEQVLLLWQEQVLGPGQDRLVILDGKEIRHADLESVSAVSGTGHWLGSILVKQCSHEIRVLDCPEATPQKVAFPECRPLRGGSGGSGATGRRPPRSSTSSAF
jgi:hypothetical protein